MATAKLITDEGIDVSDFDVVELEDGSWVHGTARCVGDNAISHGVFTDEVQADETCASCDESL